MTGASIEEMIAVLGGRGGDLGVPCTVHAVSGSPSVHPMPRASRSEVADVVQYRVGPSVGAYTGPGTAGLFVF